MEIDEQLFSDQIHIKNCRVQFKGGNGFSLKRSQKQIFFNQ